MNPEPVHAWRPRVKRKLGSSRRGGGGVLEGEATVWTGNVRC